MKLFDSIKSLFSKAKHNPPVFSEDDPLIMVRLSEWKAKERRILELEAKVAKYEAEISELKATIKDLKATVADLQEKLNQNSQNSSKPPSSDPPGNTPEKPKRKKGSRKRGGQKGHEGKTRELIPSNECKTLLQHYPEGKCDCGGEIQVDKDSFERRQVLELPKDIKVEVTEHQIFSGDCCQCGKHHRGELPKSVPQGILGPRILALIAIFSAVYHLSKRKIERILADIFSLDISLGTVSNAEGNISEALKEPVEEAKEHIPEQKILNLDETGHKVAGKKAWVWLATTGYLSVFIVSFHRSAQVAKDLISETFKGIVISDRWSAYNWLDTKMRQLCWAHIKRDFKKIAHRPGIAGEIGNKLLNYYRKMFKLWDGFKDGQINRKSFQYMMAPIQKEVEALLYQGMSCGCSRTEGTCKKMWAVKEALWTFIKVDGVEPTNNLAEQLIRNYVIWRKICFGTQSERGNRYLERILTVVSSCKLQKRNALDFVGQCIEAKLTGEKPPSLLPMNDRTSSNKAA